jgi:hypothetical protein
MANETIEVLDLLTATDEQIDSLYIPMTRLNKGIMTGTVCSRNDSSKAALIELPWLTQMYDSKAKAFEKKDGVAAADAAAPAALPTVVAAAVTPSDPSAPPAAAGSGLLTWGASCEASDEVHERIRYICARIGRRANLKFFSIAKKTDTINERKAEIAKALKKREARQKKIADKKKIDPNYEDDMDESDEELETEVDLSKYVTSPSRQKDEDSPRLIHLSIPFEQNTNKISVFTYEVFPDDTFSEIKDCVTLPKSAQLNPTGWLSLTATPTGHLGFKFTVTSLGVKMPNDEVKHKPVGKAAGLKRRAETDEVADDARNWVHKKQAQSQKDNSSTIVTKTTTGDKLAQALNLPYACGDSYVRRPPAAIERQQLKNTSDSFCGTVWKQQTPTTPVPIVEDDAQFDQALLDAADTANAEPSDDIASDAEGQQTPPHSPEVETTTAPALEEVPALEEAE